jgi:hypothetical protein
MTLQLLHSEFPYIYEENLIFFYISVCRSQLYPPIQGLWIWLLYTYYFRMVVLTLWNEARPLWGESLLGPASHVAPPVHGAAATPTITRSNNLQHHNFVTWIKRNRSCALPWLVRSGTKSIYTGFKRDSSIRLFYHSIVWRVSAEAEFLDVIGTKVWRVFLLAIHSH